MLNRIGVAIAIEAVIAATTVQAGGGRERFDRYHLHLPHLWQALSIITLPETVQIQVTLGVNQAPGHRPLERLFDVGPALAQCLQKPPQLELLEQGPHREVTFLFSFRRDGSLIAPPRLTHSDPPAQPNNQRPFADAARAAIVGCAPLRFTPRFASAIAGRPFAVRIIDQGKPIERLNNDQRTRQPLDP